MVVKKYLCAAPRPESWEEKAEALLKSLGGDKAKCKNLARQTLSMLKERHKHEKRRAGPGRKSNAEHAIAFYEYLAGDKGIGDEDDTADDATESSDDGENIESDQSSSSGTVDTEEFLNQHDDACDVCNLGGELICCATCSLVFHKECIRPVTKTIPSDWICPYCITQGVNNFKRHSKTWKSAATAIRQMKRLKMDLESGSQEAKKDEGTKGDAKNEETDTTTKEKSGADNATKSEKEQTSTNDEVVSLKKEGTGEAKEKSVAKDDVDERNKGNTSAASSVSSASVPPDGKRNLALYKIADSYSNSTEGLLVRGRRQRKQPTLYQPQLCADSRWKSDEKHLETAHGKNGDNDSDSDSEGSNIEIDSMNDDEKPMHRKPRRVLKKKKKKTPKDKLEDSVVICVGEDAVNREKTGSPFCNFCHDDASILICVFCGCRKCFGKHEKSSLLLCDNCDDEYHIHCLGLTTVPSAKKWYCPDCTKTKTGSKLLSSRRSSSAKAQGSATEAGSESVEVLEKRTRGRPSKLKIEQGVTNALSSSRKRIRTPKAAAASEESVEQRKRGRQSKSTTNSPATTPSTGRKRGRPPKNTTPTTPKSQSKASPSPTARKRGRPPKASPDYPTVSSKGEFTAKKKVTKPTTPTTSSNKSNAVVVPVKVQEPVKVSRVSGRTVKRASFHDEVDEGEQHLRSSKSPQSGESQHTIQTSSKPISSKSLDLQVHRTNSKIAEKAEPARKKQKHDEKAALQTKNTPSEAKPTKAQSKPSAVIEDKDEEMADPPPIAPVRMKPVLQPPAPPIAPVRMKPVLQPPTPTIRPTVSISQNQSSLEVTVSKVEGTKNSITNTENKSEEKNDKADVQGNDTAPTATKSEISKSIEPPPKSVAETVNKPTTSTVTKVVAPKTATPRASPTLVQDVPGRTSNPSSSFFSSFSSTPLLDPVALEAAVKALPEPKIKPGKTGITKTPRRKPGARECMQISRRFGVNIIPEKYMTTLLDYCHRGKVEHLIKMRERLDCHSRFLEYQLAGLEARIKEVGETRIVVPAMPPHKRDSNPRNRGGGGRISPVPFSSKKNVVGGSTNKAVICTQASAKKPSLSSQAPNSMAAPAPAASVKAKPESVPNKLPTKPVTSSKIPNTSSMSATPVAATKPALPTVTLANNSKAN